MYGLISLSLSLSLSVKYSYLDNPNTAPPGSNVFPALTPHDNNNNNNYNNYDYYYNQLYLLDIPLWMKTLIRSGLAIFYNQILAIITHIHTYTEYYHCCCYIVYMSL